MTIILNSRKSLRYAAPPVKVRARPAADGDARQIDQAPAPTLTWAPLEGPQTAAYASPADWIGYGGAAGGGKSDLLLGVAAREHRRALILRREFPPMRGIIDRSREVYNAAGDAAALDRYNEQLHRWKFASGRLVEFGSCQYEGTKENYRGRPYDFYGFDEATEFTESQVRFITGWNRTTVPGQRCRVMLTFNPPTSEAGRWVIRFFLPWMKAIAPELPECQQYTGRPAAPGELRYFTTIGGKDTEVPAGTPRAKSRTFYPARVEDNPYLMAQGYDGTLEAMPEPLRSQLRYGSFAAGVEEDPWQLIPSAWVRAAMDRWRRTGGRPPVPLSATAIDVARGGADQTAIARLYGDWFDPIEKHPGRATPDGPAAAALVVGDAHAICGIFVDVIGYGASCYDSLRANGIRAIPINNAEGAPAWKRDRSGRLRFRNVRAASYWHLREALDPTLGATLALPDDAELFSDLTAPRWSLTSAGVLVESKDDLIKRLGRSPDSADAVVMAYYGATALGTPGV